MFFKPKRPKWCTSSHSVCVALGLDMWHRCSFDVNSGHGCTKSPLHTVLEFRNQFLVGHSLFYNTIRFGDVVDTTMHRTIFSVEQLISLCCRVGTRNRSIISMVREERVVSFCVLTSLAFWCTSQGWQEFARVSDCN